LRQRLDSAYTVCSCRSMAEPRPFPGPWTVRRTAGGMCVDDANKKTVAYVYFVEGFRSHLEYGCLTEEEARLIANAIARVPDHGLI
jgi:hypothetical protein